MQTQQKGPSLVKEMLRPLLLTVPPPPPPPPPLPLPPLRPPLRRPLRRRPRRLLMRRVMENKMSFQKLNIVLHQHTRCLIIPKEQHILMIMENKVH